MRRMSDEWRPGPFTRAQGKANGVTSRMLQGPRFERVHPRVWKPTDHVMTEDDWLVAAQLALPAGIHLTGITRLQALGLDYGPRRPLRFVVDRDVHRVVDGVFLHRTKKLPPLDDVGVCVEAAYISYCSLCRVIDAIKVGDWLLNRAHMDVRRLEALAVAEPWRDGAQEAMWILPHLDPSSRSLKESEVRGILEFAGLPRPECNVELGLAEDVRVIGDLVYRKWRTMVKYEGGQHQDDRDQYSTDIDRYELFREHEVSYVQVTKERLGKPRELVLKIDRTLRRNGYDGPAPLFGERWRQLFGSLYSAVGPRDHQRVAS
jgi:hypothetical protein